MVQEGPRLRAATLQARNGVMQVCVRWACGRGLVQALQVVGLANGQASRCLHIAPKEQRRLYVEDHCSNAAVFGVVDNLVRSQVADRRSTGPFLPDKA